MAGISINNDTTDTATSNKIF